jgi:hypothetical protein
MVNIKLLILLPNRVSEMVWSATGYHYNNTADGSLLLASLLIGNLRGPCVQVFQASAHANLSKKMSQIA